MNTSSLSSSPGVAADLSQRSSTSTNPILHREDSLNKVYPHLIFSSQLQSERNNDQQEHGLDVRARFNAHTQNSSNNEKEGKRTNLSDFKRPLWENVDSNPVFTEQHKSYETPFYYDNHSSRVPQIPTSPYDINPLLLKDPTVPLKHDRGMVHPSAMTLPWEKNAAALIGSMYQPPQKPRLVNSKSSPADLEELSEDEKERVRVKRERNRVAAAKCRNRRRELQERLEKEAEQLEREREVLRDTVKKLQAQKRRYGSMLEEHEPACSISIDHNQVKNFISDSNATKTNTSSL